ncbi:MAG: nucleotidyltransferase family protein [Demequinaceae bacterium]|nr:nucleotidyltransferase family protein [Demequinaceae bacterium]
MESASLVIRPDATIREALMHIDAGGKQFGLIVEEGRLVGVLSDGDVRRGLLRGVGLDDAVTEVLNDHPVTVQPTADQDEVERLKTLHGVRYIPVVDDSGTLIDLIGPDERLAVELSTPVVLMAGGRGSRLYPLTKDIPKPMVPINGIPMIEVILRRLRAQGFRRIHVSVNYLGEMIEEHLGDGSTLGLEIDYLHETSPLGTAGALAQLDGRMTEPFVVMNADLLTDLDLRSMLAFHRRVANGGTVGVREYTFEIPFGVVRLSGESVESLAEKPQHRELVSAGIVVLEPEALSYLVRDEYCDMPTLLMQLMEAGHTVGAFQIHEDWIDIGRPEDLDRAVAVVKRSGS